ncbi:MAG: hypothetical protein MJZ53_01340 [Paludibacteraceae bacterium]|nr:hypothetical protein [Paludibacteraceae bacterium]
MRQPRKLIHKERIQWKDYGEHESYIRALANLVSSKVKLSGGWTIEGIINEAYYQATTLAFDFSEHIYFEADYFDEVLKRMPLNNANVVFSIVHLLLRDMYDMRDVLWMIENKLQSRPIFRALKEFKKDHCPICLYPQTDYFSRSNCIDWNRFTEGFRLRNIDRILTIAESYEYPVMVAKGILGQQISYMIANNLEQDAEMGEVERLLRGKIGNDQTWNLYAGDCVNDSIENGFPCLVEIREANTEPENEEERQQLREQVKELQRERDEAWKQSEEYKLAIEEMESQLGKSTIQLNVIAKCILDNPTYETQREAFDKINSVLVGTSWAAKAKDVLDEIISKKAEQQQKLLENVRTVVMPAEGSTTNIGCDQRNSEFKIQMPKSTAVPQLTLGNEQ